MSEFHIDQLLDPNLITREEACVMLRVSLPTLERMLKSHKLTRYDVVARQVMLDRREVNALAVERNSAKAALR